MVLDTPRGDVDVSDPSLRLAVICRADHSLLDATSGVLLRIWSPSRGRRDRPVRPVGRSCSRTVFRCHAARLRGGSETIPAAAGSVNPSQATVHLAFSSTVLAGV